MENLRTKIKQLIKEAYQGLEDFETKIDHTVVSGLDKILGVDDSVLDYDASFSVIWSIDIDSSRSGIKSILPMVSSVRGEIIWKVDKEYLERDQIEKIIKLKDTESEHYYEGIIELTSLNPFNGKKWEIDDRYFSISNSGSIIPYNLDIDFNQMKISVD